MSSISSRPKLRSFIASLKSITGLSGRSIISHSSSHNLELSGISGHGKSHICDHLRQTLQDAVIFLKARGVLEEEQPQDIDAVITSSGSKFEATANTQTNIDMEYFNYHDLFLILMLFIRSEGIRESYIDSGEYPPSQLEELVINWLQSHPDAVSEEGIALDDAIQWLAGLCHDHVQENSTNRVRVAFDAIYDRPPVVPLPESDFVSASRTSGRSRPSSGREDSIDPLHEKLNTVLRRAIAYLAENHYLKSPTAMTDDVFKYRDMALIVSIFFMSENIKYLNIPPKNAKSFADKAIKWIRSHPDAWKGIALSDVIIWLRGLLRVQSLSRDQSDGSLSESVEASMIKEEFVHIHLDENMMELS